jgi:hypothetical protein
MTIANSWPRERGAFSVAGVLFDLVGDLSKNGCYRFRASLGVGKFGNLKQLAAKLANRPMSDIAWTVNEAARLAARAKKAAIDEIDLFSALKRLRT